MKKIKWTKVNKEIEKILKKLNKKYSPNIETLICYKEITEDTITFLFDIYNMQDRVRKFYYIPPISLNEKPNFANIASILEEKIMYGTPRPDECTFSGAVNKILEASLDERR